MVLKQVDPIKGGTVYSSGKKTGNNNNSVTNSVFTTDTKKNSGNLKTDPITQKVKANVQSDLGNEILQKDDKSIGGIVVKKGDLYFNYQRYVETTGKDITLGDIKKRYNLDDGVLKKANNLRFGGSVTPGMQEGKGANLNKYTPSELGLNFVKIPRECLDKYLNDK